MNSQQLERMLKNSPTFSGDMSARSIIMAINEDLQDMKKAVTQLAELIDRSSNVTLEFMQVATEMKSALDKTEKQFRPEDGQNPATRMIGKESE